MLFGCLASTCWPLMRTGNSFLYHMRVRARAVDLSVFCAYAGCSESLHDKPTVAPTDSLQSLIVRRLKSRVEVEVHTRGSADPSPNNCFADQAQSQLRVGFCRLSLGIAINKSIRFGRKANKSRDFLPGLYTLETPSYGSCRFKSSLLHGGSGLRFCITTNGVIRTRISCQNHAKLFRKPWPSQDSGQVARWTSQLYAAR